MITTNCTVCRRGKGFAAIGGLIVAASILTSQPASAQEDSTSPVQAPVVKAADTPSYQVAFWTENGESNVARGDAIADAPDTATVITVRVFDLGKRQMFRQITIREGDAFTPPKGRDALIYDLEGKLEVKLGDEVEDIVNAGDSYRKIASQDNLYTALERTVIIETDAPSNLDE